jgi:hypothetical protein
MEAFNLRVEMHLLHGTHVENIASFNETLDILVRVLEPRRE